ncbi:MAG: hypothetical protein M3Y19_06770 [Actinomycetota bacterium]|nr:hypothetical protein [Actinomycetota bacterium]
MPGRGGSEDRPVRLVAAGLEPRVVAALVAAAPALNPSRGARARMRLRVLAGVRMSTERASSSPHSSPTYGAAQRRVSIAY